MTTSSRTPTPGADADVVGGWLATELGDDRWREATLAPIGAGRSNLTYRVDSPAGAVVLRRPPVGSVAATAHDMGREQRVISALAGSAVPVPAVLAASDGEGPDAPTDAPCFVMELVDGVVPLDDLPADWAPADDDRRRAGEALVDVLAALHAVDPAEVGLADFGRPDGFMERQIRRWGKQWAAARDSDDESVPVDAETERELTRLSERLAADVPAAQRHTIVHGDYRPDNCVYDAGDPGRILAVLDWEMSTLGDPLADVGLLLVYWKQAGDDGVWAAAQPLPGPTDRPGFPTRREIVELYAARTGLDTTPLPWYVAFGTFKLAVVLAGILARVRAGSVPAEMADGLDGTVGPIVALGHHVLDGGAF
ncbi:phosphotransferase family protein [Pseudonocardia nematodicida]|uniref:Phosphotransferase family protein n=1 Tax=Pseudonocardia nematodicida TaxID=1206997 RepID=A0ABV1KDH7_9PSEU